ncbi:hypothetical protein M3Y96_00877600 [Aphelenchoides besseyi]|nr:hypothetical protein M3Y96_00877600 [Aphelenchoides besseyi]
MFGHRQLASWIFITSIWVLVVTTDDPDCYTSENNSVKFNGDCINTETYALIVSNDQLEMKFEGKGNPTNPKGIKLNIGGCAFKTTFQESEGNGGFAYKLQSFTKATALSDKITFNNEHALELKCKVDFEAIDGGKYKVDVSDASFESPDTKSVPDWVWILCGSVGVAFVLLCVSSAVLYCILRKTTKDTPVAKSRLSKAGNVPVVEKKSNRAKTRWAKKQSKKHSKQHLKNDDDMKHESKKQVQGKHEKNAHPIHGFFASPKVNDSTTVDEKKGGEHKLICKPAKRKFVDEMTIMKRITEPPAEKKWKSKTEFTQEDALIMTERAKAFKDKFNFLVRRPMNPKKLAKIRRKHDKSTELTEEPANEWTRFDEAQKMGNKPTIKHAFDIGEGYYAIHVSTEEAQSTPTQLNTAVDKSDCLVEMPVDPLDKPKYKLLSQLMNNAPWSVRLLLYFNIEVSEVGAQVLEAKKDLQKLIDTLPGGKTREFYQSQLAAVKFIGSIADDVEGVQEGRLKPINHSLFSDANNANRKLLKQQIKNLNDLLYHCMAAEILETKQTTAFGYGKKKPRSTMAEDDGEKYGL